MTSKEGMLDNKCEVKERKQVQDLVHWQYAWPRRLFVLQQSIHLQHLTMQFSDYNVIRVSLRSELDVFAASWRLQTQVENDTGLKIISFRSDNRGEYMSTDFKDHLLGHGIVHSTPPPHSPQSNGVAEQVNRTIIEELLSLLNQSGALRELWAKKGRSSKSFHLYQKSLSSLSIRWSSFSRCLERWTSTSRSFTGMGMSSLAHGNRR